MKIVIENNNFKELESSELTEVGDSFLYSNNSLNSLKLPQVLYIGNNCLDFNTSLTSLILPKIQSIGLFFIYWHPNRNQFIT